MARIAVFFEAVNGCDPRLQIVEQVRVELFKRRVAPLPFARSLHELGEVHRSILCSKRRPALYVLNTHGAEDLLEELDDLMGEAPVFFYRRELVWLQQGGREGDVGITDRIGLMRPRLTVIRSYGPLTAGSIALHSARQVEQFLACGDFRVLETKRLSERMARAASQSDRCQRP